MRPSTPTPHLDESDLLHLVDRDASAWELDQWSKHVLACDACSEQLALLQRRAMRLSALLEKVQLPADFPSAQQTMSAARQGRARRRQRSGAAWLRAAAIVALLLLPLVALPPLRAWAADQLRDGWARVQALFETEEAGDLSSPPTVVDRSGSTLLFTPVGSELEISFAALQRAGTLRIVPTDGAEAALEILGGAGETPVLTEDGLRIVNRPTSGASYVLTIPHHLRLRVRIGEEIHLSAQEGGLRGERVIELGTR